MLRRFNNNLPIKLKDKVQFDIQSNTFQDTTSATCKLEKQDELIHNMAKYTMHRKRIRKKEEGLTNMDLERKALVETIQGWFPNFTPEFPLQLQNDFYDIGILGAESDRPVMKKMQKLFQKLIQNKNGQPVDVVTIDKNAAHTARDFRLEEILKRASLYFLFVSDEFLDSSWAKFIKTEAIEKAIEEDRTCVIPVFPDRKPRSVFGLNGIRGINIMDLLKGKTLWEVNVETLTDVNKKLVSGIEKVVRKYSYVKTKRRAELEEQRKLFTEKEKLRIIRETLDTTPEVRPGSNPQEWEARVENLPLRPGDKLEVTLCGGLKVYLPVESVRLCPVVDDTGEPIDFNKPGNSPPQHNSLQAATNTPAHQYRIRADSNGSGSSFEDVGLDEDLDGG